MRIVFPPTVFLDYPPKCIKDNLGQKLLRILLFLTHRKPTLRFWHHGDPLLPPLPGRCCLVGSKNVRATLQHCFIGGEGGRSILSEPGFRGKYSKIKHTTCIFLNILVQDCSSLVADDDSKSLEKLSSIEERIENGFTTTDEEIEALRDKLKSKVK